MNNTTTVSAKVPKELKKRAKDLDINISSLTREAIRKEVEKRERKILKRKAEDAGKILKDIPSEDIERRIRETRESS